MNRKAFPIIIITTVLMALTALAPMVAGRPQTPGIIPGPVNLLNPPAAGGNSAPGSIDHKTQPAPAPAAHPQTQPAQKALPTIEKILPAILDCFG